MEIGLIRIIIKIRFIESITIDTLIQSSYIWYIKQHLHYTGILVHTFVKVQHLFMDFQFTLVCAFNL